MYSAVHEHWLFPATEPAGIQVVKMTEEDHLALWRTGYTDYKTYGGWKGPKDRAGVFIYV